MELEQIDYLFPTNCEDCSDRAASAIWENWCNGYIVTRFKCRTCGYEWDDIELDNCPQHSACGSAL